MTENSWVGGSVACSLVVIAGCAGWLCSCAASINDKLRDILWELRKR